jgi:hypothetical protein
MRQSKCKRNQAGGALGGNVLFSPSPNAAIVNNDLAWKTGSSCMAATRPGFLEGGYTGAKGLPGMSGGKRRKLRKGKKTHRKAQRGGASSYGMAEYDGTVTGSPGNSGLGPIVKGSCDTNYAAVPPSGATGGLNMRGSSLWDGPVLPKGQMGGGTMSPAPVTWPNHGAASGSPSEMFPTARFTDNREPPIVTAAGTNLMVHTPLNYPEMNPACLKTGGGRSKKSKKSRKHRKSSKKSKKSRRSKKH